MTRTLRFTSFARLTLAGAFCSLALSGCLSPITLNRAAYYLRFRVKDRPGIIAQLAAALSAESISIEAVLQLPEENAENLPFVITVEPTTEASIRAALARMEKLDFLMEPPLAMPMEASL